jgi:hypothetical protein
MSQSAVTDATGRFRLTVAWSGGDKCFRVWASPPSGTSFAPSDTQVINIDFRGFSAVPDSVELTLRLR